MPDEPESNRRIERAAMKAFRACGDESGFTLVELLVTCVVQSMIVRCNCVFVLSVRESAGLDQETPSEDH